MVFGGRSSVLHPIKKRAKKMIETYEGYRFTGKKAKKEGKQCFPLYLVRINFD
jgi:hypothetical protein